MFRSESGRCTIVASGGCAMSRSRRLANAFFAFAGFIVICGALFEFRGEQEWYSTRLLGLTTGGLTVAVFAYLGSRPAPVRERR